MKAVKWQSVSPVLLLGVFITWLIVWNSGRATDALLPWIVLGLPTVVVVTIFMSVVATLRRRKSVRTWDLMLHEDPDSEHFIMFVYPTVKAQLGRIGWRLHESAHLSIPAIGVGIGPRSITFWEAGVDGPTLTLVATDIASVKVSPVSDGFRNHRAIQIMLTTNNRSNVLELNLRDVRHHTLSLEEMDEARRKCSELKVPGD